MASPSMPGGLQRHPSQQPRPPPTPNNGTMAAVSTQRNLLPQPPQQLQQQQPPQQQQQQQQQIQSVPQHVRFNQDLLNNYGINVPVARQSSQPGTNETPQSPPNSTSITSLIPLPSPLPNNLGVNIHHMNQASITPTILGGYSIHQSPSQPANTNNNFISQQQINVQNKLDNPHIISPHGQHHPLSSPVHHAPTGIYVNARPMLASPVTTVTGIGKVKPQSLSQQQPIRPGLPTNGAPTGPSAVVLRYPPMIQPSHPQQQQQQQQHTYQAMKPRTMQPNAFAMRGPPPSSNQLIMQQQPPMMYDPNAMYRAPPPPPQIQPTQQLITNLQPVPHMNDNLMNQQKHPHQHPMSQQVLQLPPGMLTTDDNILKSLLQINPQSVSFPAAPLHRLILASPLSLQNSEDMAAANALKSRAGNAMSNGLSADNNDPYDNPQMAMHDNASHNYPNNHHHMYNAQMNPPPAPGPNAKIPKPRKKRKANDPNGSFEDDVPAKARKRKSKFFIRSFS